MGTRLELHQKLVELLGSNHVYFQPPSTVKLVYPCIVYELQTISKWSADDLPYKLSNRYSVMLIDKNPDTTIPTDIASLPMCRAERFFTADNLYHYQFELYY